MIISIDDGCKSDIRIADLCDKYEIPCIFYWPVEWHSLAYDNGYEPLDYEEAIRIASQHEVGSHTITHRHLTAIPEVEAFKEIMGSQYMLRKMFRQPIKKFAPPRGYSNPLLTEFTLKFYEKQRLTKEEGLVHIHPNSGANNNRPWREVYDEKKKSGIDNIECWLHSWELDKYNLWEEFEDLLRDEQKTEV